MRNIGNIAIPFAELLYGCDREIETLDVFFRFPLHRWAKYDILKSTRMMEDFCYGIYVFGKRL